MAEHDTSAMVESLSRATSPESSTSGQKKRGRRWKITGRQLRYGVGIGTAIAITALIGPEIYKDFNHWQKTSAFSTADPEVPLEQEAPEVEIPQGELPPVETTEPLLEAATIIPSITPTPSLLEGVVTSNPLYARVEPSPTSKSTTPTPTKKPLPTATSVIEVRTSNPLFATVGPTSIPEVAAPTTPNSPANTERNPAVYTKEETEEISRAVAATAVAAALRANESRAQPIINVTVVNPTATSLAQPTSVEATASQIPSTEQPNTETPTPTATAVDIVTSEPPESTVDVYDGPINQPVFISRLQKLGIQESFDPEVDPNTLVELYNYFYPLSLTPTPEPIAGTTPGRINTPIPAVIPTAIPRPFDGINLELHKINQNDKNGLPKTTDQDLLLEGNTAVNRERMVYFLKQVRDYAIQPGVSFDNKILSDLKRVDSMGPEELRTLYQSLPPDLKN